MAANASLTAELRDGRKKGAARKLRAAGLVPGVVYGGRRGTRHIAVNGHDLALLFARVAPESTVVELKIGGERPVQALVRELQQHPYKPVILHVDFLVLRADQPVDLVVPVRLVGTPAGVLAGGVLQQALHDIPIRCLPGAIPEAIEADVSALEVGDSLHVSDLVVPEGVTLEIEGERTVCSVQPPTTEPVEAPAPEAPEGVGGEVRPELVRDRPEEEELPPATGGD